MVVIVLYPRLNLVPGWLGLHKFGLMHLVATNVIIWIRTVIKESILEFNEAKEEHSKDLEETVNTDNEFEVVESGEEVNPCSNDIMFEIIRQATPILFAFIIEFVLIGATVFYNMWHHVEPDSRADKRLGGPRRPNVKAVLTNTDWSNSLVGAVAGMVIFLLNVVSLSLFFSVGSDENLVDEYIEKVTRCVTNSFGLMAVFIGISQLEKLQERKEPEDASVDLLLLNLSATFIYIYMCFTITVGVFTVEDASVPSSLHVVNGIIDICQVTLQIVFINLILRKVTIITDTTQTHIS